MPLIINGEEISDDALEEEFDAIKEHYEAMGEVVCCDRDEEFRGYAFDNTVNRTLLCQESVSRYGEPTNAEIEESLAQLKVDHGGEEQFYQNIGLGPNQEERIRRKVSTTLSVDKLLREEVGPDPDPTEDDLRQYHEEEIQRFMTPAEVRSWHIYLEPKSPEEGERAYELLRETRKELKESADFEAKAKEICADDHEMDLGFYRRDGRMHDVEAITFSMDVGEISPIVATHFGYHIFKVIERKEPEPVPFETLKDQLDEQYRTNYRETRINALLEKLKAKSKIEGDAESIGCRH